MIEIKKAQGRLTKLVLKYNAMYITFHQASSLIHVLITSLSQFFFLQSCLSLKPNESNTLQIKKNSEFYNMVTF